jgi:predicted TPR repeat methyltransferase
VTRRGGAQDAAAFLAREPASEADIVLAADVAPWVGALEPLLAGAAHALAPGGLMALSTEERRAGEGGEGAAQAPRLSEWVRFVHAQPYVEAAAAAAGFEVVVSRRAAIRYQGAAPVQGRAFVLRRGG